VVDVPDPRVDVLSRMFNPKKTIYAKVTYADIAGLDGSSSKSGISGALLNQLTQMDGFIHVIRCFEDDNVPHPQGSIDPARDLSAMDSEFVLNDLIAVERKLERLAEERKKGAGRDRATIDREIELFERLQAALNEETPLRDIEISADDEKTLSGFGFLSRKPVLVVLNLAEGQSAPEITYNHKHSQLVALQGKLEMDIAHLPPEDAEMFMAEYGIEEPSLNRMIRLSYDLLGLQSFFTVGPDEVRAWTVRRGATAPEAAGEIHTDLQKGFIRAEVVAYDDLINLGGMSEARAKGKLRLEGKEYIVQEGEIVHIRHSG
ncbi:MAG: redox-regulated ATPase YchF, partial [Bellilinea sp.]